MHRAMAVLLVVLTAGVAAAQQPGSYAPAENPYQADVSFTLGKPIDLFVEIEGIRLDGIVVLPGGEVRAGEQVACELQVIGTSVAERKATINAVILFEDAGGKSLERVSLDAFKAKAGRPFDERQKRTIPGDTLAAATAAYIFVEVKF